MCRCVTSWPVRENGDTDKDAKCETWSAYPVTSCIELLSDDSRQWARPTRGPERDDGTGHRMGTKEFERMNEIWPKYAKC